MTRKHKPHTAHKKRSPAPSGKPVKSPVADKAVAAVASARDKDRARGAPAAKKAAAGARPALAHPKMNDGARPDARSSSGKAAADKRPLGIKKETPHNADERQSQLKLLIARGKEQGFLTYVEVNDHLPSEIVDPEQIEDIVNMINDMGIPVYEKAPDAESLLLTDATAAPDEEAVEEATAALANLDAEFGRTTDPVRMYMREMGTVELLTREGEIRIAKRIEEGLEAVKIALGSYPGTYDLLLRHYETVKAGQMRLVDVIVGFVDPNAPDEIAQPQNPKMMALEREEAANDDDETEADEDEEVIATGPDPEEAAKRFNSIAKAHHHLLGSLDKLGSKDPKTLKIRKKICGELMELKLSPKMFDQLIDNLREHVTEVRLLEKEIMFLCIKQAGMPRKDFISTFPKNETSTRWLDKHIKAKKRYSAPLAKFKDEVERRQNKLKDLEGLF